MGVVVRYQNNVTMTYHLTAYSPWEGYHIGFNGTKGRLEIHLEENSYREPGTMGSLEASAKEITEAPRLVLRPLWANLSNLSRPLSGRGGAAATPACSTMFLSVVALTRSTEPPDIGTGQWQS